MGFGEYRWRDRSIPEEVWDSLEVAADLLVDFVCGDVECGEPSEYLIDLLPSRYSPRYDFAFVGGFLGVLETVRDQLWDEHTCRPVLKMAEQLALGMVLREAEGLLAMRAESEGIPLPRLEQLQRKLDVWADGAFPDPDHELLYEGRLDGIEHDPEMGIGDELCFDHWFDRFWPDESFPGLPAAILRS